MKKCVARLGLWGVFEIERRPRGASRMNPLLHLLQRAIHFRPCLLALVQVLRQAWRQKRQPKNLAVPTRLSTMAYQALARCNKCRSGFIRDAPRGRRSVSKAKKLSRRAPAKRLMLAQTSPQPWLALHRQSQGIRLPPGNLHRPQPMLQLLARLFILDTLKRATAVAVGEHQVVGHIHQHMLYRHDAFANGAAEGFAGR